MNKWKILGIISTILSFGALKETYRIFTSNDADIVNDRSSLMITSVCMTLLFVAGTAFVLYKLNKQSKL